MWDVGAWPTAADIPDTGMHLNPVGVDRARRIRKSNLTEQESRAGERGETEHKDEPV